MYIYHHITENNQSLFGFLEKAEKKVFTELIKIS
jgi:Holliday junction resolvasome RuvABC DNA-binding subunit